MLALSPLGGGAGNATANLARDMAAKGHEVTVMTSAYGNFPREEMVDGFQILRIPARRASLDRSNPLEMLIFYLVHYGLLYAFARR